MSSLVRLLLFKQCISFRIVSESDRNLQHPNVHEAKIEISHEMEVKDQVAQEL